MLTNKSQAQGYNIKPSWFQFLLSSIIFIVVSKMRSSFSFAFTLTRFVQRLNVNVISLDYYKNSNWVLKYSH